MYNEGTVLVEFPECRRMLFVGKNPYFVSLPRVRIFVSYVRQRNGNFQSRFVRMCFVKNKNKSILVPPLPNVFSDLKVCCPTAQGKTLEDLIAEQAKVLFASQFNDETWDTLDEYYYDEFFERDDDDDELSSVQKYMAKWMKKTKKNPNWIPKKFAKYHGDKSDFTNPEDDDY